MPSDTKMECELEDVGRSQMGVRSVCKVKEDDPVHLSQVHEASLDRQKPIPIKDATVSREVDLATLGSINTISSDEETDHQSGLRGDSFYTSGYASTKPSTCVESVEPSAFSGNEVAICSGGEAPNITGSPLTDSPPRSHMTLPSPPVTPEKDATRARVSQRASGWHTPLLHTSQLRASQLRSASASPITPPESPEPDSQDDLPTETEAGDSPVDCSNSERLSLDSHIQADGEAVVSPGEAVHGNIGITPAPIPTIDHGRVSPGSDITEDVGNIAPQDTVKVEDAVIAKTAASDEVGIPPSQKALNDGGAVRVPSIVHEDVEMPPVQNVTTDHGGFRARSAYYGSGGVSTKVVNVPDRTTPPGPRGYYGRGGVTTKVVNVPKPLKRKSFEDEYFTVKPLGGSDEAKQLLAEQKAAIAEQCLAVTAANRTNSRERRRGWLSALCFRGRHSGIELPRPSTPVHRAEEGRASSSAFPDLHPPGPQFAASVPIDNGSYGSTAAFGGRC